MASTLSRAPRPFRPEGLRTTFSDVIRYGGSGQQQTGSIFPRDEDVSRNHAEPLIEIEFDSETIYISRTGIRAPHAFYQPLLAAFGEILREIGLVPGDYQASQLSIEVLNASGLFSRLRDTYSWRNRIIRVLLGNPDIGWDDFQVVYTGRIATWSLTKETVKIEAVDTIQSRLFRPLGFIINSGFFSELPDETPRALAPLVMGEVSSPGGALPAYLVNPAAGITPYRYLAAQGVNKEITEVYAYGVLVAAIDYEVTYASGPDGEDCTYIDFDADQRIAGDTTEPHVSWSGSGLTDDGTDTGNPINNPAEQLNTFLLRNGFVEADIDAAAVAAAANAFNLKQIRSGFAVVDKDLTVGDVVRMFAENFNLQVFSTNDGKVGITAPSTTIDEGANLPIITALHDIGRDSMEVSGPEQVAATLFADYGYNFYLGEFQNQLIRTDPMQISALGEDVPILSGHPFIRDSASMAAVADTKMFFLREQRHVLRCLVGARWHRDLDIGSVVRLTHFAGIGQQGYEGRIFRVIGIGLIEASLGTFASDLALVDLKGAKFFHVPLSDFTHIPYVFSDYLRTSPVVRGRLRVA